MHSDVWRQGEQGRDRDMERVREKGDEKGLIRYRKKQRERKKNEKPERRRMAKNMKIEAKGERYSRKEEKCQTNWNKNQKK